MFSRQHLNNIRHAILDRDGVINEESPTGYILSPEEFIWIDGAIRAMAMLVTAGIEVSVATNQSCVGRGLIDEAGLDRIHDRMKKEASGAGVSFGSIVFCPHLPEDNCGCRKPAPGLLENAIRKSRFPAPETVFIGDADRDLQAAAAAGITAVLVRTGKGADTEKNLKKGLIRGVNPENVTVFDDLLSACAAITETNQGPVK